MAKSLDGVDPELRERVQNLLAAVPSAWVASAFRSFAEQTRLYNGWMAGLPGFAPANRPGTSMHELGLAVDVDCATYDMGLRARVAAQCGLYTPHSQELWHFELAPNRTPLDSSVIPTISVHDHGEIALMKTITYSNVQLDTNGNGWVPIDADVEQIQDITQQGSFPPADGYWTICKFGKQQRNLGPGKRSVIEITGGTRKQVLTFYVQVAA